jgi:uncharacterized protein (TIGR00251 family)
MQIKVRVIPRAKKQKIEEIEGILRVYLNEPAEGGRANKKLIEVLAEHFKIKKYNLQIIRGLKTRDKLVEISGIIR